MTAVTATSSGRDWQRIGLWLVGSTMVYNTLEALVAVWAGVAAGSIALVGFGLDSVIELSAGALLLWRLRIEATGTEAAEVEHTEQWVHRFVGITFFALSAYILVDASLALLHAEAPRESLPGIILATLSLLVMPLVAWGKLRAARAIGSRALAAEAKETLACSYLSFTLLLGLGCNALAGWWWADPAAALLMVPWLLHEGWEGIHGEDDDG